MNSVSLSTAVRKLGQLLDHDHFVPTLRSFARFGSCLLIALSPLKISDLFAVVAGAAIVILNYVANADRKGLTKNVCIQKYIIINA